MRQKHFLLLVIPLLFLFGLHIQKKISASHSSSTPQTFKVFEIIFNPIIESQGNRTLIDLRNWNNPLTLNAQFVSDVQTHSHGYVNYRIERIEVDDIPQKKDGFDYTDETYLDCLSDSSKCHQPDTVDYAKIFTDFDICTKVLTQGVSEVWLWGGPWFGYWEYNVKGPRLNITPENIPQCGEKTISVMGFSYERGITEMLENYGHRAEGILKYEIAGDDWRQDEENEWNKFSLVASPVSSFPYGHCGNVHYPPNGISDYDYGNTRFVDSDCDDYYNYPNLSGTFQSINCQAWGCNGYGYLKWWLDHLPHASGSQSGHLNDWWRYIVDYDSTQAGKIFIQVSTGLDDVNSGCTFKPSTNEVYIGIDENCGPSQPYTAGFRFLNVPIPQAALIESAVLEFTADGLYTNPLTQEIRAEASDSSSPFSESHQPANLPKTASAVSWGIDQSWPFNTRKSTPDVSPVLQEIVNRPGWQNGNAMIFTLSYLGGNGYRRVLAFERSPSQATRLVVRIATHDHIGDLDGAAKNVKRGWQATVTVVIHNSGHQPITSAQVNGTWSDGYKGSASCTTDSTGRCSLTSGVLTRKKSTVTFTVNGVSHAQLTYDSSANHDPDGDSNGTAITISRL